MEDDLKFYKLSKSFSFHPKLKINLILKKILFPEQYVHISCALKDEQIIRRY